MATYILRPTSDILTQWDFPILGDDYAKIDETTQDGDSSYIADTGLFTPNGTGPIDSFGLQDWTNGPLAIEKVEVVYWARLAGRTGATTVGLILDNDVEEGTTETLSVGGYTEFIEEFSRPGGGNWNWADLDDLQVRIRASGGSNGRFPLDPIRVTQIYIKITTTDGAEVTNIPADYEIYPFGNTHYCLTSIDSDLSGGDYFDKELRLNPEEAETTQAVVVSSSSTETSYGFTSLNSPGNDDWETGKFVAKVTTTTNASNLNLSISVSMVEADGSVVTTSSTSNEQNLDNAGTYIFIVPSIDFSPGNITDRIRVNYIFRNSSLAAGVYIKVNSEDTQLSTLIIKKVRGTVTSDYEIEGSSAESSTINTDYHLIKSKSSTVNTDYHLIKSESSTVNTDYHLIKSESSTINTDYYIVKPSAGTESSTVNTDYHLIKSESSTINTNYHLIKSESSTVNTDYHLIKSESSTVTTNYYIARAGIVYLIETAQAKIYQLLNEANITTNVYSQHSVAALPLNSITIEPEIDKPKIIDSTTTGDELIVNHQITLSIRIHTGYVYSNIELATSQIDLIITKLKTNIDLGDNYRFMSFEVNSYDAIFTESATFGGEITIFINKWVSYPQN